MRGLDLTLATLRKLLPEIQVEGPADELRLTGIASLDEAGPEDLSFLGNLRYRAKLETSRAGAVLVPSGLEQKPAGGVVFLRVPDPSRALAKICENVERQLRPAPPAGIHPSAVVEESAQVDASASVGPLCYIAQDAVIGARTVLRNSVTIGAGAQIGADADLAAGVRIGEHCVVGDRVCMHSGVVIGGDGFGYAQEGEPPNLRHVKLPQIGIVRIGNDVEIGANSTIDRARFGETFIGEGTKIDNLVQIAHNVRIGKHCIIVSQVGISGSTTVEDFVVIWGQVGVAGHITIGTGSFVAAQAGVSKSLPPGSRVSGTPAFDLNQCRRSDALTRRLPELFKKVQDLGRNQSSQGS